MKFTRSINDETANCIIEISLSDPFNNGHEDFAITATFWEIGKPRKDRYLLTAGCCHDSILAVCPEYTRFVHLHLRDFKGAPMYTVENGFYHAKHGGPAVIAEYFDIPNNWQAEKLCKAASKEEFTSIIHELQLPRLWQMQADAAIYQLEKMTGEKFVSKATKSHFQF